MPIESWFLRLLTFAWHIGNLLLKTLLVIVAIHPHQVKERKFAQYLLRELLHQMAELGKDELFHGEADGVF